MSKQSWKSMLAAVLSGTMIVGATPAMAVFAEETQQDASDDIYVLMNIPYSEFYGLVDAGGVDIVSGATAKVRNSGVAGATYNGGGNATNLTDVTDIAKGVQFAVKVNPSILADEKYTEVTAETSYNVAYSGRGKTTEKTLTGFDALIQADDYAYYVLSNTPENYIELTADGFGAVQEGQTVDIEGSAADITYGAHWGSYLVEFPDGVSGNVAAVKVVTDAQTFGLTTTDHIWRSMEIAWSPEDGLEATNGATLESIIVYTDGYIYKINYNTKLKSLYSDSENVSASLTGKAGTVSNLPEDIENAKVTVSYSEGSGRRPTTTKVIEDAALVDGQFEIPAGTSLEAGKAYTVTVSSDNYIDISATAAYDNTLYVLMNIPYSVFYGIVQANDADIVSAATAKVRNAGVAGATYNGGGNATNLTDVTDIAKGVQFAVKVDDASLLDNYTEVTNATTYNVAYSGRGQTTEAPLTGKAALIQADDYAYVALGSVPSNYLELTSEGFSEVKGEVTTVAGSADDITYGAHWGTYLIEFPEEVSGNVAAVKVVTDTKTFGLTATNHIWRSFEIAWSPEDGLEATNGATLKSVIVYTDKDVYEITYDQKLKADAGDEYTITASIRNSVGILRGLPADIKNPKVTVSTTEGRGRSAVTTKYIEAQKLLNDIFLVSDSAGLQNGQTYDVTVSSDNYLDFTTTAAYEKTQTHVVPQPSPSPVIVEPEVPFTDLEEDSWYYDAVVWAYKKGYTAGTTTTTFSPTQTSTRAQVITFLYNYAGKKTTGNVTYSDVAEDAYYYDAVLWAEQNSITAGTGKDAEGNDLFSPNAKCTRAQLVTLLYHLAGSPEVKGEMKFADVSADSYYYNAVLWVSQFTDGTGKDADGNPTFSPDEEVNRAMVVTFLYNMAQYQTR